MKQLIYIILALCVEPYDLISQNGIQCEVPLALMAAYENDVKSLAIEEMLKAGSPDTSSIEVIGSYETDIWTALTSAYLDQSAETDSVFDLFCVHNVFTPYTKYWIYVSVDTNFAWTDNWINGQSFSGNNVIDSVLADHPYIASTPFAPLLPDAVKLEFEEILNLKALTEFLELQPGVVFSERVPSHGDGDRIFFNRTGDIVTLEFLIGWGDCLAGCTVERSWFFEVDVIACLVNYTWSWGANVNIYYPGHGQALRIDCNLSTDVHDLSSEHQIYVYPNPVNEILSIESEGPFSKFVISDSLGKICTSGQVHARVFDINLRSYCQGIYFVTLYGDQGETYTSRILKQ